MDKKTLLSMYDYLDLVVDVTCRALENLSARELDFKATPEMRTLREIAMHIFSQELAHANASLRGTMGQEHYNEDERAAKSIRDGKTLADWARDCHHQSKEILKSLTEAQVAALVALPYGEFPAWKIYLFSYDEHWHHRGQIYTYLRLMGKEPLFLYDYKVSMT